MSSRKPKRAPKEATPPDERAAAPGDRLRPWLLGAATALLVARPLFPSEAADQGDGLAVVMLWIVVAAFWALACVGRPRFRVRFGWTDLAVAVLIVAYSAAALHAAFRGSPRPAVNMLWQWIGLGVSFVVLRQLIVSAREARAAAAVMIALAVALSGYGLYQYVYELPQTRAAYAENPDQALREAGLWYPPGSPARQLFESRLDSTEPLATFALTNSLAGYLAPWLVVTAGVALAAWGRGWRTVVGAACLAAPIVVCLALTHSRTAWLASGLGLVLIGWTGSSLGRRLGWKLPAAALIVVIAGGVALFSTRLHHRAFAGAAKSLGYRFEYWESTLEMIRDHPLWGCGPGQYQDAYTAYKLPQASEEVADPHNFLLEVWATAGTPALLALLGVLGSFGWTLGKRSRVASAGNTPGRHAPAPNDSLRSWWDGSDAPGYVCGGAACGLLLSWPLGMTSTAPVALAALAIAIPFGAIAVALLFGWIRQGRFPAAAPACGLAALLINLLAAGGISFPGVAGSAWLLLALGLWAADGDDPRSVPRSVAIAGLATAVVLAAACYATTYRPVLRCQAAMQIARAAPSQAETYLHEAAAADPLSAAPWQELASYRFARWEQDRSEEDFRAFEEYDRKAAELAPRSASGWLQRGDRYLQAFLTVQPRKRAYLERAASAYREAAALYPNSALHRAKLALALRESGDQAGFQREARAALRLDRITPHVEKKLPAELRDRLL